MVQGSAEPAPPTRRSARREATRQRVLDAAREVFAERGVFGGTVEEICARAGYTRGAFYSSFADKAEALEALIAREHAMLIAHLDAGFGALEIAGDLVGSDGSPAALAVIADRLLRSVPSTRQFSLIWSELEIHAVRAPEVSGLFREADARFRARIAEYLERGLRALGRELVVGLDDATEAVMAVVERSTRRALLAGPGSDPFSLARTVLPALILGASRPRR